MDGALSAGLHPLIVISHGTGGTYLSHYDTATALAQAGFDRAAFHRLFNEEIVAFFQRTLDVKGR